jgi:hypothetical protein
MGESSPTPSAADPPRQAVSRAELTPLQQAYSDYVQHALACDTCRNVDGERCAPADALWQVYRRESDEAYRGLSAN